MNKNIIPFKIDDIKDDIYSGFLPRLGANLLDFIIVIPVGILFITIKSFFVTSFLNLLFIFWYNVYLPKKYGGTPGKLSVRIKIIKIDSSQIGWREAILRESITIIFSIIGFFLTIITLISATQYLSILFVIKRVITILSNIWFWSEIIVLLFNKRKRALHDYIAGTVIIKSEYVERVQKEMESLNKIDRQE